MEGQEGGADESASGGALGRGWVAGTCVAARTHAAGPAPGPLPLSTGVGEAVQCLSTVATSASSSGQTGAAACSARRPHRRHTPTGRFLARSSADTPLAVVAVGTHRTSSYVSVASLVFSFP